MVKATTDVKGLAKAFGVEKKSVIDYLSGIKDGTIAFDKGQSALQNYQNHLKSISTATTLADIGTQALTASMKVLSTVGWMAAFAIASLAIGKVVGWADDLINKVQKTKERVDDLMSSYGSAIEAANNNATTAEGLVADYERLSKGVNNLGQNISLTTDEYAKYNNIVNQIADMFPGLITGYDSQGNAILTLKGNVELLREEYKKAQEEAYNLLITSGQDSNGNDIIADFKNKTRDENFIEKASSFFGHTSTPDAVSALQKLLDATTGSVEDFKTLYDELYELYGDDFNKIGNAIDTSNWGMWTEKDIQSMATTIKSNIQTLQSDLNLSLSNVQNLANAYLMTNDDYKKLDEQSQNAASIIVNSINQSLAEGFNSREDVGTYVQYILDMINLNPDVKESMIGLLTLDYTDMPIEQSAEVINQYINYIAKILGEDPYDLKIRLGFNDFNDLETQYQNALAFAQEKFGQDETDFFNKNSINTKEEIDNWLKVVQGANSAAEAERKYLEQRNNIDTPSFISEFEHLPIDKIEEYISLVKSGNINDETISSFSDLKSLMAETDMNAEDAVKAINNYADGFTLSTDLAAGIQEAFDLLQDVSKQYKETGKIGLSSLESIANQYPQLRSSVNAYTQGLISASDMVGQLSVAYENDANAFRTSMAYRLSGDEDFFSKIKDNNQTLFNNLATAYGLDIDNWKTMAQAKAGIDQVLIKNLSEAWSRYYNIVFDSASGLASFDGQDIGHGSSHGVAMSDEQQEAWSEANKQVNKYNQIIKQLNEAANITVKVTDFGGSGSIINRDGGSGSKAQEEAKQEIDWIAHKTKVVQDSYAKLEELASKDTIAYLGLTQEEFDNAKSIFDNGLGNTAEGLAQLQSYANEAGLSLGELYTMIQSGAPGASKENALQSMLKMQTETLLPQYQREVEAYSKSYEDALKAIPSEYKDKIESGGADVESLPADLAKKVQTAIDANEKLKLSEKQLADGEKEHIETIKKLHENRIEATDIENEKLEQSNKIIKSQMELMEARGEIVDADFYKRQMENNKGLISGNQKNIDEWESEMADLRAADFSTDSKDYKELQAKVEVAKNEIQRLKLEQEEFNQTLKQMPIDNLSTIISMYDDITAKIENWGTVYTATGQKLDGEYYQTLISNGITVIEQYGKQAKLVKNLMGEYEKGSTKWQELYKQLQDIDSATSSMLSNLKKYNEELLKMPLDSINSYSDSLQKVADGLSNVQSEQDLVIGTVTNAIQKQIDIINDQKDAYQEANESQKKGLQDKLDLLQKQNDQLKRQMAYEQSLYNLQKINQQATELVIRNGQESYEVDADKLREAQEQVANAKFDLETGAIQDQIDSLDEALEKQNELYDSQIEKLEIILNHWSEISEKVQTAQNEAKTSSILGNNWKGQVLSGNDTALFNTFSKMYQNTAEQFKQYQDQIDSTNNIQSLLEDYVASYKAGEITYSEAVRGINTLLAQLNQNMSATGNLQNIFDYLGIVNDTSANADSVLKGIQSGLKDTATELLKSMEQYNKNAGIISEHTSSWQKLTSNVEKMLDVLREVRDNLKDSYYRDDDDDNDNTRYGGGRDGSPGTPGKGDYVDSGPGVNLAISEKDGIARGLIGSYSDSDREASMKLLGLKKLDSDEIPAVLHMGEAVFNKEQQQKLLDNFASAYSFAHNIPDYSNLLNNVGIANRTTTPVITFNGGINIQECNNSDDLASEILNGGLTMAINQGLGRR